MDLLNGKCDKISDLLKRETERQLDLKKKQQNKKLFTAENEKVDYFDTEFNKIRAEIENDINNLNNFDGDKLTEQFDIISKKIIMLQKFVANSNFFLRVYDIKKYQEILNDLSSRCNKLEEQLIPKKKFSFKNRSKNNSNFTNVKNNSKDEVDCSPLSKQYLVTDSCGFKNLSNKSLLMKKDELSKKDIRLENLINCTIKICGNPSTLHLSKLETCTILSGPVSTSVFADNCKNCVFVLACQQLRLHSSTKIDIYLHVTSRAIIEDSTDINFAPYNLTYDELDQDFAESGLNRDKNNWTLIDDFNWLSIDKPSPNWHILNDENKCKKWSI